MKSFLLKWALALIPGGQVAAILSTIADICLTVLGWFLAFVKWLVVDITDAFKEPQRLAVRIVCLAAVLIGGLWGGITHKARKDAAVIQVITQQRDAARTEVSQWRTRHADEEKRADAAEKARAEAEAKIPAPAPAAAPVQRVRPRAARPAAQSSFLGLQGIFAVSK